MKITADTNVLVRAITGDDERQSKAAQAALAKADVVALALPAPAARRVQKTVKELARPAGFEPTTHSLEGCCSIQLS
jgi:hypothetical protein